MLFTHDTCVGMSRGYVTCEKIDLQLSSKNVNIVTLSWSIETNNHRLVWREGFFLPEQAQEKLNITMMRKTLTLFSVGLLIFMRVVCLPKKVTWKTKYFSLFKFLPPTLKQHPGALCYYIGLKLQCFMVLYLDSWIVGMVLRSLNTIHLQRGRNLILCSESWVWETQK